MILSTFHIAVKPQSKKMPTRRYQSEHEKLVSESGIECGTCKLLGHGCRGIQTNGGCNKKEPS